MGSGKGGGQTIGYWYDMDIMATLCHGKVDANTDFELVELRWGDRTGWTGSVTTSGSISVYKKDLFGGETREGGVNGQIDIMMGTLDQPVNEFLGSSMRRSGITGPVPAYRGEFSLFFRGATPVNPEFPASGIFTRIATAPPFQPLLAFFGKLKPEPAAFRWSAMNPYFKAFKARLRRYWKGWYATKARIGNYSNPAHIIFECLTNSEWGMGYPQADMDDTRFRAAADALYTESFGLGLVWRQQTSIQDFIGLVTQHINAVVNQDRTTGKVFLRLIRNDYDVEDLIELNPYNSTLESYSRPGFGETVNEVTIKYVTSEGQDDSVTVQDIANITSQGQIIAQTIEMPGIHDPVLAARIAQRELESRSRPICKLTLITNRIAFDLYEGECFIFSWPDHGIDQMICRAVDVNLGSLQDNKITIEAIEDVFGMPLTSFVNPQPGEWIDPSNAPAPSPLRYITETPYYDLARTLTAADLAQVDPTDCAMDVFATPPSRDALDYQLWTASGSADVELRGTGSHTAVATLTVAAVQEEFSTFTVDNVSDILDELTSENVYLVINGEYVRLDNYNATSSTFSVARGVLDTVPKVHAVGSKLMLGDQSIGRDHVVYIPGEVAKVRVQTRTSRGTLDIGVTPQDTYTFTGRQNRPYPPGKFRVNSVAYPTRISGIAVIGWAGRNRLLQTASIVAQDVSEISPEAGTSYDLVTLGETGATISAVNTTGTALIIDEYASNIVYDYSANRVLVTSGLSVRTDPVSTAINYKGFTRIDGGWMRVLDTRGEFVDGVSATQTNRTWASAWDTATYGTGFVLNPTIYQSTKSFDPYAGFAVAMATTVFGDMQPTSSLSATDHRGLSGIRDRRNTGRSTVGLTSRSFVLVWWATNRQELRIIARTQTVIHVVAKSAVVTGPMVSTRLMVAEYYTANPAQFTSASGYYGHYNPPYTGRMGGFQGAHTRVSQLASIFGSLLYVPHYAPSSVENTAGKPVSITNVISAHFDYATSLVDKTAVYQISLDGAVSLLATRNGVAMADKVTSTEGVEVVDSTIRSVNLTTGVLGGVIATLPGGVKVTRVSGDTTTSTFYIMGDNGTLYRYNMIGVLLASIALTSINNSNLMSTNSLTVTAGYVYYGFGGFESGTGDPGSFFKIEKDLSAAPRLLLNNYNPAPDGRFTAAEKVTASETDVIVYASVVLDEVGASSALSLAATPRYNDELTIELSSTRNGVISHQKHSLSVTRAGWGLRWDESWGG